MDTLLPVARAAATAGRARRGRSATAPSLLRGILQCVLLEPDLAHRFDVPEPTGAGAEGDALAAVRRALPGQCTTADDGRRSAAIRRLTARKHA